MAARKPKRWIQKANIKEGGLHKTLGKKANAPITEADLQRAEAMGGKAAKQARLARTFKKMARHRKGGKR